MMNQKGNPKFIPVSTETRGQFFPVLPLITEHTKNKVDLLVL